MHVGSAHGKRHKHIINVASASWVVDSSPYDISAADYSKNALVGGANMIAMHSRQISSKLVHGSLTLLVFIEM